MSPNELRRVRQQFGAWYQTKRWMSEDEARILMKAVEPYQYYYECGTANGWSACWAAMADCKVITFDPGRRPKIYDREGFEELKSRITFVNERWEDSVWRFIQSGVRRTCLIDGDHRYKSVVKDLEAAIPWFSTIIVHDTNYPRIRRAVHNVCKGYYKIFIPTWNGIGIVSRERLPWLTLSLA